MTSRAQLCFYWCCRCQLLTYPLNKHITLNPHYLLATSTLQHSTNREVAWWVFSTSRNLKSLYNALRTISLCPPSSKHAQISQLCSEWHDRNSLVCVECQQGSVSTPAYTKTPSLHKACISWAVSWHSSHSRLGEWNYLALMLQNCYLWTHSWWLDPGSHWQMGWRSNLWDILWPCAVKRNL